MNAPPKSTVPIAQSQTNECHITPRWFVDKSEYNPVIGGFKLLMNGQEAYREIHRAIEAAKHSVRIICWGFQPSMHFIREGNAMRIGELLEYKAMNGILVEVLCYASDPAIPYSVYPVPDATGQLSGEANTPGRRGVALGNRPVTHTDEQFEYDQMWYGRYNQDSWLNKTEDRLIKYGRGIRDMSPRTKNLKFVARGFSPIDRASLAKKDYADKGLSVEARGFLSAAPSHHQKMVVIDYGDKDNCVGFLMGHNMLDEYWDTNDHSCHRKPANIGRNGIRPRHDFSCRLAGPIVGDLYRNFAQAWHKETGDKVQMPDFSRYPYAKNDGTLPIGGQIVRTQSQHGVEDIKNLYLQAVGNATQYIHIENQYFRWPPLAEKIKEAAIRQTSAGRAPELDGPLYLFVITNADDEGMGPGVRNTYRMLESLGRADRLPAATRQLRPDDLSARLGQVRQQIASINKKQPPSLADQENLKALRAHEKELSDKLKAAQEDKASKNPQPIKPEEVPGLKVLVCTLVAPDSPGRSGNTAVDANGRALTREERVEALKKRLEELDKRQRELASQRSGLDSEARMLQGVPNTASDLTARYASIGRQMAQNAALRDAMDKELHDLQDLQIPDKEHIIDWVDVYIHAKLMMIDDAFMTLGSANINTRSMEVDSELNIAHDRPDITLDARRTLWGRHTNGRSGNETIGKEGIKEAHDTWMRVINDNKNNRAKKLKPVASLVEFYSGTSSRKDRD